MANAYSPDRGVKGRALSEHHRVIAESRIAKSRVKSLWPACQAHAIFPPNMIFNSDFHAPEPGKVYRDPLSNTLRAEVFDADIGIFSLPFQRMEGTAHGE